MFYDLLEVYRKNSDGDTIALDNYSLSDGLYIKLYLDNREPEELLVDKNTICSDPLYVWFNVRDYYSRLIEMNKPVDPKKKIHSNNMYAIFFKRDTIIFENNNKGKELSPHFKESLGRYFDALAEDNQDNKALDLFGVSALDQDILKKNKEFILSKVGWMAEKITAYNFKKNIYIKLFFDASTEVYRQECMRYQIPRIFNTNKHNLIINGNVYGLSNMNMNLNAKKPYLEHKTTNYKVPFRIGIYDALDSKNLLGWLENQKNEEGKSVLAGYLPVNEGEQFALSDKITDQVSANYLQMKKGMKTSIDDYDFLPGITNRIKPFELKNFLQLKDFNTDTITKRDTLEKLTDQWLYNKNLISNYYNDKPKPRTGFSARQVDLLIKSKNAMLNFFRKCDESAIRKCFDKVSLGLIKQAILINSFPRIELTNIAPAMNLRLSMLRYFKIGGKEDMGDMIQPLWNTLKKKVVDCKSKDSQVCDNDTEFYYAAGQLTRYFISLSQAQKINYSVLDPLMNAKDSNKLKAEIINLFKKYNHAVDINSKRLNILLAMVMGYQQGDPQKVMHDAFIAGLASQNIIYYTEKKKEDDD